jgi:hypothetical protein
MSYSDVKGEFKPAEDQFRTVYDVSKYGSANKEKFAFGALLGLVRRPFLKIF